jgi:D-alanyl-D-alanine carboxypeptidase
MGNPMQQMIAYAEPSKEPEISAQAAILMDVASDRVLFAKNADQPMKVASLTKIMTAIIAIEKGELDQLVRVSPKAVGIEGSSIYLKAGDQVPLRTLLYGLMLRSGNDAAMAIAEHIGGSVEGFVYLMNEKATYLGLKNTHFMNPHGLDKPNHYSSAHDLAILTSYALKNPVFREIVKTKVIALPWPGETWRHKFYNKNKLLRMYSYADGVKTGFTKQAGRTLVTSATKNGQQLVAVTLNDPNDWLDSTKMFEYGFRSYQLVTPLHKGQVIVRKMKDKKPLELVAGEDFRYPLTADEKKHKRFQIQPIISYPLQLVDKENISVGSARIYLNDQLLGSVPLLVKRSTESTFFSKWKQILFSWMVQGDKS